MHSKELPDVKGYSEHTNQSQNGNESHNDNVCLGKSDPTVAVAAAEVSHFFFPMVPWCRL